MVIGTLIFIFMLDISVSVYEYLKENIK
jgi:hypothetical protein